MFTKEDTTFNELRENSLNAWLSDMEQHEDLAVKGGVKLCREYLQALKDEINRLREENKLKNEYLKKMAKK